MIEMWLICDRNKIKTRLKQDWDKIENEIETKLRMTLRRDWDKIENDIETRLRQDWSEIEKKLKRD